MAAIDFPANPQTGDIYTFSGRSWQWNGYAWTAYGTGGTPITVTNDNTTNATEFPLFAAASSGSLSNVYTADPNYTYNPALETLTAPYVEASQGIFLSADQVTQNFTIPAGTNGLSAGPIDVITGVTVTVNPGTTWVVV